MLRPILSAAICLASLSGAEVDRPAALAAQVALIERESALAIDRAALWAGASRGLVQAVDPYGLYLSRDEVVLEQLAATSQRLGLGFDWRADGNALLVTRVVPGSPADKGGLHPGCRITAVDDRPISVMRLADGLHRFACTTCDGTPASISLAPAELNDDGIAHCDRPAAGVLRLRIGRFMPAATAEAATTPTFQSVRRQLAGDGVKACIIDLRGCSGGTLQAAVEIAAGWLPVGAVVIEQHGRDPARSRSWRAEVPRLPTVPVIVLIDGATASSAEVLAHTLRRVVGASLIGSPSVGKWSLQQTFLLSDGDALRLTVATISPPGGASLSGPLLPDVTLLQEQVVTWARWRAELAGWSDLPPDAQLERAVAMAMALPTPR